MKDFVKKFGIAATAFVLTLSCGSEDRPQSPAVVSEKPAQAASAKAEAQAKVLKNPLTAAVLLANAMQDGALKVEALAELGVALAKTGDRGRAEKAFDEAFDIQKKSNLHRAVWLAERQAEAGLCDRAVKISLNIANPDRLDQATVRVARKLIESGHADKVAPLISKLETADVIEKAKLADIFATVWDKGKLDEVFKAAMDELNKKPADKSAEAKREKDLLEIIGALAATQRLDQAEKAFESIKSQTNKAKASFLIASHIKDSGNAPRVKKLVGKVSREAKGMKTSCLKVSAMASVASAYKKLGADKEAAQLADAALKTFGKANAKGGDKSCAKTGRLVLSKLADGGFCTGLNEALSSFEDTGKVRDALIVNAGICIEEAASKDALAMIEKAREIIEADKEHEKFGDLAKIAGLYARAGERLKAIALAESFPELSRFRPHAWFNVLMATVGTSGVAAAVPHDTEILERVAAKMGWAAGSD